MYLNDYVAYNVPQWVLISALVITEPSQLVILFTYTRNHYRRRAQVLEVA